MSETTQDHPLPYGGTVTELRQMIARHAQQDEATFGRIWDDRNKPSTEVKSAHHGALYGWSLVAILRWLGEQYGPDAARKAAEIVQDLGENDHVSNAGMSAVFVAQTQHPIWPALQLVVWRMQDGSWSHDALSPYQDVGHVALADSASRLVRLRGALLGGEPPAATTDPEETAA